MDIFRPHIQKIRLPHAAGTPPIPLLKTYHRTSRSTQVFWGTVACPTLILYNDAPAAFPARVAAYDYYTGAPDQTDAGGAPTPQPGFGPNIRTIMQVVVGTGTGGSGGPANFVNPTRLSALQAAFAHHADGSGVFESSQDPIIVGQAAYNSAYFDPGDPLGFRSTAPRNGVARISDFSMTFNTLLTKNDLNNVITIPFQPKALHDEMNAVAFDEFGRMTANIGLEAPNPTPGGQNIILYPYINPPVRSMAGSVTGEDINGIELPSGTLKVTPIASATDGTQIWRITHNGVGGLNPGRFPQTNNCPIGGAGIAPNASCSDQHDQHATIVMLLNTNGTVPVLVTVTVPLP